MLPLFAAAVEASPDPAAIKQWLEVAAWLAGIAVALAAAWKLFSGRADRTEIAGQPLQVREAHELVTQREHEQLAAKLNEELGRERSSRKRMHEEIAGLQGDVKTLSASVGTAQVAVTKLETKIDANTALTARIDGKVEHINQSVHTLSTSVTQFLQHQAKK